MDFRFGGMKMLLEQLSACEPCLAINHASEEKIPIHYFTDGKLGARGASFF